MTDALHRLAEGWRTKAARLTACFGKDAPNATGGAVLALESCAQDIDDLLAPTSTHISNAPSQTDSNPS